MPRVPSRLLRILLVASSLTTPLAARAQTQQQTTGAHKASVVIHADTPGHTLDARVFGQFVEHLGHGVDDGLWVGPGSSVPNVDGFRSDIIAALREIRVPEIRWPGGCFADTYDWRDGIGPASKRPTRVNVHWGSVPERNAVGTHEFMNFTESLGAKAYIAGNLGSATPRSMADWVEYMTYPAGSTLADERVANGRKKPWEVAMIGVGNELWGCGGNMSAEDAAVETRRYASFVTAPEDHSVEKIASGASGDDTHWTEVMMAKAGDMIDGIGVHYYTVPGGWDHKVAATGFDETAWAETLGRAMHTEDILTEHSKIMDKYDPRKRVGLILDEWGTWYKNEPGTNSSFLYQQNSLRDALVAALTFTIFTHHADRLKGANIAQMVNVLQAMFLTKGDKMLRTPTYWAFDMYKDYQNATVLPVYVDTDWYGRGKFGLPTVSASAVRDSAGAFHIGLVNADPDRPAVVRFTLDGAAADLPVSGHVLSAPTMDAHNTFENPDAVTMAAFSGAHWENGQLVATLPAKSVVMLDLR